ncbi:unnamed protein product, partial [marine sediment metagenome]
QAEVAALKREDAALKREIAALKKLKPIPAGNDGARGPVGPPGPAGLAADEGRVNKLATTVGGLRQRLDGLVADTAGASGRAAAITAAATALGFSAPPAALVWAGVVLFRRWRRKRNTGPKRDNRQAGHIGYPPPGTIKPDPSPAPPPRTPLNDSYAKQLTDVFALSGHSPTADATLGREYDRELLQAAQSSDGALAAWAKKLRERVAQSFYRIHDRQPMPAEPVLE